ncbi:hypothetical protein [Fluviicola sp.]|uniref:hypothetical protein n=1 Tax=Fluviicola sp. TaxID=1917219 RepID=UPI0031E2D000
MQNFSFDFNFFEESHLLDAIQAHINVPDFESKYNFFGMIGVWKNGFYKVFDSHQYRIHETYILGIKKLETKHYLNIAFNDKKEINLVLFFSSTKDEHIKRIIETSPNFEFVVLLFSKEEFDAEKIKKRHKKSFTFRSKLSRKRWLESEDFLEMNFNILHNRCVVVISG